MYIATEAPPLNDTSAACADTATSEPAKAVKPIFLMFIINYSLIVIVVIINNKHFLFITVFKKMF